MPQRLSLTGSLLICVLATCGCAANGRVARVAECPRLAPPPPALMKSPDFENRVRQILFESPPKQTPQ